MNSQWGTFEPWLVKTDWARRVPFRRFETLNMEQKSWPTDTKPTLKSMISGDEDPHDKRHHWYESSEMEQPNSGGDHHNRQLLIQDMEPISFDTGGYLADGKRYMDPAYSVYFAMPGMQMDKDWLTYPNSDHRLYGGAPL